MSLPIWYRGRDGSQGRGNIFGGEWKSKRPSCSDGGSALGIFTMTRQRFDVFTTEEQDVLSEVEVVMKYVRRVMHQRGYNDGDPLPEDDQKFVIESLLNYLIKPRRLELWWIISWSTSTSSFGKVAAASTLFALTEAKKIFLTESVFRTSSLKSVRTKPNPSSADTSRNLLSALVGGIGTPRKVLELRFGITTPLPVRAGTETMAPITTEEAATRNL